MLTMALPIALVRLLDAGRWRERVMYAPPGAMLMAAVLATDRKSAIVAPVAVVLVLAYFRRRELLRLAPLGVVLAIVVLALSPGALKSTVDQFTRSDAQAVGTVSDRTADYDAIRPDVWSHLAFGRGYGSYNHDTYRILDSEVLLRTIEGGVFGLASFLLIGVSVIVEHATDDPLPRPHVGPGRRSSERRSRSHSSCSPCCSTRCRSHTCHTYSCTCSASSPWWLRGGSTRRRRAKRPPAWSRDWGLPILVRPRGTQDLPAPLRSVWVDRFSLIHHDPRSRSIKCHLTRA